MNNHSKTSVNMSYALLLVLYTVTTMANAFNLTVTDENGVLVDGFKWTLEENLKFNVEPGVQTQDSLSLSFHNSYSPLTATGECTGTGASSCPIPADPGKQYFITALPFVGHTLGGAKFSGADTDVEVAVHTLAIPTAQITVRVFHDNHPINGAPDDPEELTSLFKTLPADVQFAAEVGNFTVHLAEAGGRFGQTGGEVSQDAYGNPLGTTYVPGSPGTVAVLGNGILTPDADGYVYIQNIPPAKYGVTVIPPAGQGWIQTSTIEGTKTIDAWVLAGEPTFFAEFGPPGPHAFIGFVKEFNNLTGGPGTVSGRITSNHMARPPEVGFFSGAEFGGCWVGLSTITPAPGDSLYSAPCDADSNFSITGIPDGTYNVVVWDQNLDIVIAYRTITLGLPTVQAPTLTRTLALGDVPVFAWFGRTEMRVFLDENENGFREDTEQLIPEQATGFRFRNGTPYQGFPTDLAGEAPYDELFPFFHWLVAEVDYARYKATGVTYVVDAGGAVPADSGWAVPSFDVLNPQPQDSVNPVTGNNLSTTLTGPVISLASQVYLGQTNVIEWGKALYGQQDVDVFPYDSELTPFPGVDDIDYDGDGVFEYGNGGISGLALYAITRAEDDPRYAAAEEWEPGIPRIQMNLYRDFTGDGIIDDVDGDGEITLADTDNAPQGNFPGAEDVDRPSVLVNGVLVPNGYFDYGDAIQVTYTDSWDDSLPTGCVGDDFVAHPGTSIEKTTDCYDGLRNFNQLREGVYDGGYAFTSTIARDTGSVPTTGGAATAAGGTPDEVPGMVSGYYIVESAVPNGYVLLKEEDKNVDFGDEYVVPAQLPPVCVGDDHTVTDYLSYQSSSTSGLPLPGIAPADLIDSPYAGEQRPLCDRKQVALTAGKNAAADFFMFTQAPVAAHVVGGILNDLGNEFDPGNPNFGEKFSLSWAPVTFSDWTGKVITKVYTDEFGKYDALVPSTATVNIGSPTGLAPNMLSACMNDPSPVPNPLYDVNDPSSSPFINDPFYNPQFSTFCYTFQYMPGSTTYLDTPVVPVSAFASTGNFPLDCAIPDNNPLIKSVEGNAGLGPIIMPGQTQLTIASEGLVDVPNHLFGSSPSEPITISRNYGFGGAQGTVMIGAATATVLSWSNTEIIVNVPNGTPTGQLVVTTASGIESPRGITVTTDVAFGDIGLVFPSAIPGDTPIQNAIDAASPGDLISIRPGTYGELVIMDKPVRLQGWGAGVTKLTAIRAPASILADWRQAILDRTSNFDYLPGQETGFMAEEGPGIIVLGQLAGTGLFDITNKSGIDGMDISGATSGGGIFVNAYVDYFNISNNRINGNEGTYGGGIRVGNPTLATELNNGLVHADSDNDFITIHSNEVVSNGTSFGTGGGIGLYTGTDNYSVDNNFVCGNFSQNNGGGIAHLGLSNDGEITNNIIAFNQNFNQGRNVHGGGVFIGGQAGLELQETEGSGNVLVEGNLIQGNSAAAGLGGGIILSNINGVDVAGNPGNSAAWFGVDLFDNIIVNNHAGWTGAGIAMQDAAKVRIVNNTIAHNDATATVGNLFDSVTNTSTAQIGAGIASFAHSPVLAANSGQTFSDPELQNNIIWENRTFSWTVDISNIPAVFGLIPDLGNGGVAVFSDLAVVDGGSLNPLNSILTDVTGTDPSNTSADPEFVISYFNGDRSQTVLQSEQNPVTVIGTAAALDEGGNFVDIHYGPLSLTGDYHLRTTSPAIDNGVNSVIAALADDHDGDVRGTAFDIGADEVMTDTAFDVDVDGVTNHSDNCTLAGNPNQLDSDNDGYGNVCDADLNNDGIFNVLDIPTLEQAFLSGDLAADANGDGVVNVLDIPQLESMFLAAPGPSGIAN